MSPTKQARGDSRKQPKLPEWRKKKTLGETRLSRGGSVLLWPDETSSSIPTAAKSDCAEDSSGSRGLVAMAVSMTRSSLGICLWGSSWNDMLAIAFLPHIRFCSYYRVGLVVVQMVLYFKTSRSIRLIAPKQRHIKHTIMYVHLFRKKQKTKT